MRSKSARSTPTLSAIPWYATPALDPDAEGADLARLGAVGVHPAAGMALPATRGDAERGARVGERGLERADVRPEQQAAVRETQDRVRDELAGPVVGHLATALHAQHLDPAGGELRRGREHVGVVRLATQRQHRGVLEQQQLVVDPAVRPGRREALLQVPGLAIGDPAQPARFDRLGLHGGTIAGTSLRAGWPPIRARLRDGAAPIGASGDASRMDVDQPDPGTTPAEAAGDGRRSLTVAAIVIAAGILLELALLAIIPRFVTTDGSTTSGSGRQRPIAGPPVAPRRRIVGLRRTRRAPRGADAGSGRGGSSSRAPSARAARPPRIRSGRSRRAR